jgi:hypothetical protein
MIIGKALKIKKAQKEYRKSKRANRLQQAPQAIEKPIVEKKSNNTVYIVGSLLLGSVLIAYLIKSNKK